MKKIIIPFISLFMIGCSGHNTQTNQMEITIMDCKKNTDKFELLTKYYNYKKNLESKNIEFKINSKIKDCLYKIYVDDILINNGTANEKNHGVVSIDASINHTLLKSGKHNFRMEMFPIPGKNALGEFSYGDFKLWFWDVDKQEDDGISVLSMRTPSDNLIHQLPFFKLETEINLELPFSIVGWTNSINLKEEMENGKDLKREIQNSYDNIITIIKNRDVQAFSKLIKEREELLGVAFYSTAQEKKDNLNEFLEIIQNPDYELQPYPEKAELHFFAYGKLITLSSPIRESVIELINKKTEKIISLDFYLHRKSKGSQLEVIL